MERDELKTLLRRLFRHPPNVSQGSPGLDVRPGCTFGVAVDQRLEFLEKGLGQLKSRLNSLIFLVVGAVVVEIVLRLVR